MIDTTSRGPSGSDALRFLARMVDELQGSQLSLYQPNAKQKMLHDLGGRCSKRLLMAGNQQGKSTAGAAETAFHLTGLYPKWWTGKRYTKPIRAWAGGDTTLTTRDIVQRKLLGPPGQLGTGMLPKGAILECVSSRGLGESVDFIVVQHLSGGKSYLGFRTYEQGRKKWQGDTLDWIWFDEEPPGDIWTEGLARLSATSGHALITFTPMLGMSEVVREFYPYPKSQDRGIVQMTLDDASHLSAGQKTAILDLYPEHEREARISGVPMLGSGRIFTAPERPMEFEIGDLTPASYWRELIGLDLGAGDHPTAWVRVLLDPNRDCLYVTDLYKNRDPMLALHATSLRMAFPEALVAWPKDALRSDVSSGQAIADLYRRAGVRMLADPAQWANGGFSVEAGIAALDDRMRTGRLKIARHLTELWSEIRTYHRLDGLIVKSHDDLLDALRYALMMIRYAKPLSSRYQQGIQIEDPLEYDPLAKESRRMRLVSSQ